MKATLTPIRELISEEPRLRGTAKGGPDYALDVASGDFSERLDGRKVLRWSSELTITAHGVNVLRGVAVRRSERLLACTAAPSTLAHSSLIDNSKCCFACRDMLVEFVCVVLELRVV
jgi:hypothetical protein